MLIFALGMLLGAVIGVIIMCLVFAASKADEEDEKMTANEYQTSALRTLNRDLTQMEKLTDGLMGLNGEAGECIDILKKHLYQGHGLDREHIAKELGDVAWYLAVSANAIGYDLDSIFEINISKLQDRYPEGFDKDLSIYRNKNDI